MKCKACKDEINQIKAGKTKAGTPRSTDAKYAGNITFRKGKRENIAKRLKNRR